MEMEKEFLGKYSDLLVVDDLVQILHLSKKSIYKLLDKNTINSVKIGNKHRILKSEVVLFLTNLEK